MIRDSKPRNIGGQYICEIYVYLYWKKAGDLYLHGDRRENQMSAVLLKRNRVHYFCASFCVSAKVWTVITELHYFLVI